MIYEIRKGLESLYHPGIESNLGKLIKNSIPYYLSFTSKAFIPLTIYWSVNNVCNLRCKMCDIGTGNREGTFFKNLAVQGGLKEIDIDVFRRVIDEVASWKPFIAINSTEPLLYSKLYEALLYCSRKNLRTGITTNGYALPGKVEELVDAGLARLNVSIDGPPEVHDEIRGKKGSFSRAIEGIQKINELQKKRNCSLEIFVVCTITNINQKYLVALVDAVREYGIDRIIFTYSWFINNEIASEHNALYGERYPVTSSCLNNYIDPLKIDINLIYEQTEILSNNRKVIFLPRLSKEQLRVYFYHSGSFVNRDAKCMASWFIAQILADGSLIPYSRCHNQSFGNVNEQSFLEIWNGNEMQAWRRFIRKVKKMPMCRRCDLIL